MRVVLGLLLVSLLVFLGSIPAPAQATTDQRSAGSVRSDADKPAVPAASPSPTPVNNYVKDLLRDQKRILSSPIRLRRADAKWIVPLAATTAFLIYTDRKTSSWVDQSGTLAGASRKVSYGGNVFIASGFATGLYLVGRARNDSHAQRTGKLAFEALVGTSVVIAILKNTAERTHPNGGAGNGRFFQEGRSFPSGHASDAWAVATVIGEEYRKRPLIRYSALAAAIAISLARYSGRAHFASEVLVGSAIGYSTGRFVYAAHH